MKKMPIAEGPAHTLMDRAFSRQNGLRLLVVVCVLLALASRATAEPAAKNVLVLSGGGGHSGSIDLMESTVRSRVPGPVDFFSPVAELEEPPFEKESYRESLAQALRRGFGGQRPDLVIAVMDPSLRFALEYRDKMFPGVPIVFMSVSSPQAAQEGWRWPGATGVASAVGIRETIDLGLRLHPDTRAVAVITNTTETEKDYFAAVHSELLRHQDKVREIDLIGPASGQMLERVAALPAHTLVLFQLWDNDAERIGIHDFLAAVAQRLPTYCIFTGLCLNHGGIGGAYDDATNDAVLAGRIAARVLLGERPDNIPVVHNFELHPSVDWRELRRWHIPETALPPGTRVLYREPTLWERGRKYFQIAIAVIVVQALLIFGLFWHRARRRKTEAELRRSEEKFSKSFRQSPLAITISSTNDGRYIDVNDTFEQETGWWRGEIIGRTPFDIDLWVDPAQRVSFLKDLLAKGSVRDLEFRIRRKDGQIRTALGSAELIEVNGELCALSVAADITERKLAEQALAGLSGRLIEAQEEERKRIARELHDDISQKLALLSMEVAQANRSANGSVEATKQRLSDIRQHCSEIAKDIQSLSHQLHYSKLDYLGLVGALKGFCREFAKQYDVRVDFEDENVPRQLPKQISLCLFRVTQEALRNAVKYSGTQEYTVKLSATADELQLVVRDAGTGFDVTEVSKHQGLGLVSMQERMHLIQGHLHVESSPGEGTTIVASAPVIAAASSTEAEGDQAASVPGAA